MANRAKDWLAQAYRGLAGARHAAAGGFCEWACFAAQQAAEKAIKGLLYALNGVVRGHGLAAMLERLPANVAAPRELVFAASKLEKYYTLTRYPNGFEAGVPGDHFLPEEAAEAITYAEGIVAFCRSNVPG